MTINLFGLYVTLTVTTSPAPKRRSTDIQPVIDTAQRDQDISSLGVDLDSLREQAKQARASRHAALAA